MPKLTVRRTNASGPGRTLQFGRKTILVGRSPNCTICLKDPEVSRLQFAVSWRADAGWILIRHESARPVLVNDVSIDTQGLIGGDIIRVGSYTLTFQEDDAGDRIDGTQATPVAAACPERPLASLVIESATPADAPIPITKDITVIGRGESCDVRVKDRHCSRNHAEIYAEGEAFVLRDLGSMNGVFVNDTRVDEDVELRAGDLIRMGESRIRFGMAAPLEQAVPAADGVDTPVEAPSPGLVRPRPAGFRPAGSPSAATWMIGLVLAGLAGAALTAVVSMQNPLQRQPPDDVGLRPRSIAEPADQQENSSAGGSIDPLRPNDSAEPSAVASRPAADSGQLVTRSPDPPPAGPPPANESSTAPAASAAKESGSTEARAAPRALADLLVAAGQPDSTPADDDAPAEPPQPPPTQAVAAPADPAVDPPPAKRLAIPDASDVAPAKQEVYTAYGDELSGGVRIGDLVARLIEAARQSTRTASKFALLDVAQETALRQAAYREAVAVINARSDMFELEELEDRLAMLATASRGATRKERELFDLVVDTANEAVRAERFEAATKAAALAVNLAASIDQQSARIAAVPQVAGAAGMPAGGGLRGTTNAVPLQPSPGGRLAPDPEPLSPTMTAQRLRTIVAECKALNRKYGAAVVSLAEKPGDPKAREVVGTYVCFVKQDWTHGLDSLAVGRDERLRDIAARELAVRRAGHDVADMFALASAWWDFAGSDARPGVMPPWYQEVVREHAARIYEQVVDDLSDPVEEKLARRRIAVGRRW